jgi:sugar phosphate isomerase/epimerase
MMNRRTFLKTSASATLGGLLAKSALAKAAANPAGKSLGKIGLQLYTVRDLMKKDFTGTLEKVAAVGYKEVEFAGYFDNKPEDVRKLLDRLNLKAPATHISIEALRDRLDSVIQTAKAVGHQYIVCPWLSPMERSLENYKAHAAFFNKVGEACRKAGIQFAYHNHDFEFETKDGKIPYDVLLDETDSKLVQMELDLFWIKKGGHEALAYFAKYPGRFALCHVKDMDENQKMVDVGRGKIDFGKIFAQAKQAGLKHFFVEHDEPKDSLQSITASCQYLKNLKF